MAMWIKIVLEAVLALVILAVGSSFWSLVKLPKFLLDVMKTPSNLELLQLTSFTGVMKLDTDREFEIGYPALLFTDIQSSISAWKVTKYLTLVGCLVLMLLSFLIGANYFFASVVVFCLSGLMDIQSAAKGNVFRDVQVMLGRIDRWSKTDPEECLKYCTETNPKYFREMYLAVEKRNL